MIERIRFRPLATLAKWQKWALNESLNAHGVVVVAHLDDGGLTLGKLGSAGEEMRTIDVPGASTVADALAYAARGLRDAPVSPEPPEPPVPLVLVVLFWVIVIAGFSGLLWLAHIWSLAEATYYREGMR